MVSSSPRRGARFCARSLPLALLACAAVLGAVPPAASAASFPGPDGKLDSHLQQLLAAQGAAPSLQATGSAAGLTVDRAQRVLVDVYVDGEAAQQASALRQAGFAVEAATNKAPVHMVEGWLPVAAAQRVAALSGVRAVVPVMGVGTNGPPGTDTGNFLSQGDAAHNGPQARAIGPGGVGPTGAGVDVGLISDSMNRAGAGLAGSQASGDLPTGVQILKEGPSGSADEGRAMGEIVYDEAPGVTNMMFASGTTSGPAGKADSINQLTFAGADVVADDIFYLTEPFFQDGAVAQAVDNAKAHGVAYFVSAGNRARQSWQGAFQPSNIDPQFHDFAFIAPADTTQTVAFVPNGSFLQIALQWDEPWGQAATDIDIYLVNANNGNALAQDITDNRITGLPSALATWTNNTGATVPVGVRVRRFAGTGNRFFKYIARGNFGPFQIVEWDPGFAGTIDPDAALASGALTVAAVDANESGLDDPEAYSSRGPAFRIFDKNGVRLPLDSQLRQKPLLAGADDVTTSVPGFQPFTGTSAAAPSAAGVAALVKSAKPALSVDQLSLALLNPANGIDCTASGRPDQDCGFGFVLADRAVRQVLTPAVTSVSPANGAASVFPNANLTATFSEPMDHATTQGAIALRRTSDGTLVSGRALWFGEALVFDPSSDLQSGVQYTATISTAARSTAGINLPGARTWTFATTNRPVVETVSPANGATGVSRSTKVIVGFSKAMNKTATQSAFSLRRTSTGSAVSGSFTSFGNALIFTPSTTLAASTRYTAAVSSGARDTSGNTLLNPTT